MLKETPLAQESSATSRLKVAQRDKVRVRLIFEQQTTDPRTHARSDAQSCEKSRPASP